MQLPNISFRFPRVRSETSKKHSSTRVRVSMPVPEPAAPPFPTVHHGFSEEDKTQTTSPSPSPPTTNATAESDYEGSFSEETHTDDEEEEEQEEEEEDNTFVPPQPSSGVSFFQGASNYQITGSTFTVINGNGRVTQQVASNPGGGASPTGSGSGISFGNDWPFGPNNDPFAQGATPTGARTTPRSAQAERSRPSEASRGSRMEAPRARVRARNQYASSSQGGGVFFSMTQTDNNSNRRVTEYTFDQLAADGFANDNINTLWVGGKMYINGVCVIDTNT